MARKSDILARLAEATLKRGENGTWREASFQDVLADADLSLSEVYPDYRGKPALVLAVLRYLDRETLQGTDKDFLDPANSIRDRLFDLLMMRFDLMNKHRAGMTALISDLPRSPSTLLCVAPQVRRSMAWYLEAAGVSTSSCVGHMRVKGLMLVYATALRCWLKDEGDDMAKTMKSLDSALAVAEKWAKNGPKACDFPLKKWRKPAEEPASA